LQNIQATFAPETKNANGYVLKRTVEGYQFEHRLVAEEILGFRLPPFEHVHHINFDKMDNSPENLCVMNDEDHLTFHKMLRIYKRAFKSLPHPITQLRLLKEQFNGVLLCEAKQTQVGMVEFARARIVQLKKNKDRWTKTVNSLRYRRGT